MSAHSSGLAEEVPSAVPREAAVHPRGPGGVWASTPSPTTPMNSGDRKRLRRQARRSRRRRSSSMTSRSTTVTPVHVADLVAEGELMPVYAHVIDHPDGRVLVDTGIKELHPLIADMDPRLRPWSGQDVDLAGIDMVVNTHLHFDHCGGNHLFAGKPVFVQRRELDDA